MRELRFGRRIGRGSTGEVYEGFFRGQNVAIKKLQAIAFRDKDLVERFPSKPAEDPLPLDAFTPAPAKGKKAKKGKRPKARRLGAR